MKSPASRWAKGTAALVLDMARNAAALRGAHRRDRDLRRSHNILSPHLYAG